MDWHPFRQLVAPGYDIAVIWDYRDLMMDWSRVMKYDEVCVVAWSLGVFAASLTVHEIMPHVTKMIAINGTLDPIHERFGIAPAIYHGTINGLTPQSLRKFHRRMCTSAEQYERFHDDAPRRDFSELADELNAIESQTIFHVPQIERWDMALIGRHDAIFHAQNQLNAWRGKVPTRMMECGHLPDFNVIIRRLIIDKERLRQRFNASAGTYDANATAQADIARSLFKKFQAVHGDGPIDGSILEIGSGHGALSRLYAPHHHVGMIHLWDLSNVDISDQLNGDVRFTCCDAELMIKRLHAESVHYIFSSSTVQWFNSQAEFFNQCERVLKPGGFLVISAFVHQNLQEVEAIVGNSLTLPTLQGWLSMVASERMNVLVCQSDAITLNFPSPRAVIEHLRDTGVNSVNFNLSPIVATRRLLTLYPRNLDGTCDLTYRPVYIIAQKISDQF
jgi:malonyl-ACP O-methyltransferase BioC